ncbi:uncharacterized protein LOC133927800 [Phragmites australis]|uniref:uncharacterized protein LOC133927800 n=1 Tax=Phragmites australis TaxID=29695 RepID=UPI002D7981A9|nr:uncharacterized protein LOC133927800 [Phragmites australis]
MRTFYGHNPEGRRVHNCKSQPSKKKLRKLPENVEVHIIDDYDDGSSKDHSAEDRSKQLVLYNPEITHDKQRVVEVTEPIDHYNTLHQSSKKPRYGYGTVLPSIGVYTVQCACCFKWRVVPTKEKYEELRESICQELFVCSRAREWNRALSCEDPEDMSQDGSRVWAIDKPNIVQPPPGWDREVRIRGASSKFADVYYTSPSGKRLRSMVEIGRYLAENPHYIRQGVNLSQFSFATPKPLEEDYVRKRTFGESRELPEIPEVAQGALNQPKLIHWVGQHLLLAENCSVNLALQLRSFVVDQRLGSQASSTSSVTATAGGANHSLLPHRVAWSSPSTSLAMASAMPPALSRSLLTPGHSGYDPHWSSFVSLLKCQYCESETAVVPRELILRAKAEWLSSIKIFPF